MRTTWIGQSAAWLAVGIFSAIGCSQGHSVVFPNEGRAGSDGTNGSTPGSTMFMMLDSNYIPQVDDEEWLDLHAGRIAIAIEGAGSPPPFRVYADLRAVIDLEADSWATLNFIQPGVTGTIAIFDLPSHDAIEASLGGTATYPYTNVKVIVEVDGSVPLMDAAHRRSYITIRDKGGVPQELMSSGIWANEEQILERPTSSAVLRLRGKRDNPGTVKAFEAGQTIGSIAFDFLYNENGSTCVDSVIAVRPRTEAHRRGFATVAVDQGTDRQRVSMVAPRGINLTFVTEGYYDDSLAGQGPFLDLLVREVVPGDCDLASFTNWFAIENLRVTDLDGVELFAHTTAVVDTASSPAPSAVLRAYLIDPTPGP